VGLPNLARASLAYRAASCLENFHARPNSPMVIPSDNPAAMSARRVRCRIISNVSRVWVSASRVAPAWTSSRMSDISAPFSSSRSVRWYCTSIDRTDALRTWADARRCSIS